MSRRRSSARCPCWRVRVIFAVSSPEFKCSKSNKINLPCSIPSCFLSEERHGEWKTHFAYGEERYTFRAVRGPRGCLRRRLASQPGWRRDGRNCCERPLRTSAGDLYPSDSRAPEDQAPFSF